VSTEKPTIFELIGRVMADVQAVGKNDRNTEQGYSFRGIEAVVNAAGPAFRKHGVVPAPMLRQAGYRDVLTSRGKPSRECTVEVCYRFHGPAGDYVDAIVPGESMDFGDKGAAKAMSVAYRIALLQVLCIPTDEPDADHDTYERAAEPEVPQVPPERARQNILLNARVAIGQADEPSLTAIGARVDGYLQNGAITDDDAIKLRRLIVARLDEIHPADEQAATAEAKP
jgi:hypothetical protein